MLRSIGKAVAAGLRAVAIAAIRLLVALGKLPLSMLAAMAAAAGGEDDVPEAPAINERRDEIADVGEAPTTQPKPTVVNAWDAIGYCAANQGFTKGVTPLPAHWPEHLQNWLYLLPEAQYPIVLSARTADLQAHIEGRRPIPGLRPVKGSHEFRIRRHREVWAAAESPQTCSRILSHAVQ